MPGKIGPLLGQGRTAEVFEWDSSQVIKLFRAGFESSAERELEAAKAARTLGANTPAVHDLVRIDGRVGVLFERAAGRSLMTKLSQNPWLLRASTRRMAAAHLAIHRLQAPSLPRLIEQLQRLVASAHGLTVPQRTRALAQLAELPDGNSLCHGDFHPGNLLEAGKDLTIIDWSTAGRGHPLVDVAVTTIMMRFAQPPAETPWALRQLIRILRQRLTSDYLAAYGLTASDQARLNTWTFALAAARLGRAVDAERDSLLRAL
ncbi:MAG: phosphotransferase [Myxococcota bacterium]